MQTTESVEIRDLIFGELKKEERSLSWLARRTGINYNTLYQVMSLRTAKLSDDKLDKINTVLGTNFTL